MSRHAVDIEQAHRLREAETQWLRQSAARLSAAHRSADRETVELEEER